MGRNINTSLKVSELEAVVGEETKPDNYAAQIIKLIPAEIVGVYLGLQNIFAGLSADPKFYAQSTIFLILLIISPFYLKTAGGITDQRQRIISVISYCIWSISLGGPFEYLLTKANSMITAQHIGGALIMIYTLIVPILYKTSFSKT